MRGAISKSGSNDSLAAARDWHCGGQGVHREVESEGHEEKYRAVIEGAAPKMNRSAKGGQGRACATMAYLSNTDRVRHPPIFMMTPSATPARRRLRAAVRRSGRASQEALIRAGGYAEIGLLYTALAAS